MSVYEQRRPCSAGRGLVHKAGKRVQPCLCYGKKRSPSAIFLGRTPTLFLISSKLRILRRSNIFLMRYTSSSVCSNRGAKRKTIRWSTRVISCRLSRRNCGNTRGFPVFPWWRSPASGKFQRNFPIRHPPSGPQRGKHGGRRLLPFGNARHRPQCPDVPEPPAQKTPGSFP